jgi:hypothetical protein
MGSRAGWKDEQRQSGEEARGGGEKERERERETERERERLCPLKIFSNCNFLGILIINHLFIRDLIFLPCKKRPNGHNGTPKIPTENF